MRHAQPGIVCKKKEPTRSIFDNACQALHDINIIKVRNLELIVHVLEPSFSLYTCRVIFGLLTLVIKSLNNEEQSGRKTFTGCKWYG